jgi:hypothetical protein
MIMEIGERHAQRWARGVEVDAIATAGTTRRTASAFEPV